MYMQVSMNNVTCRCIYSERGHNVIVSWSVHVCQFFRYKIFTVCCLWRKVLHV